MSRTKHIRLRKVYYGYYQSALGHAHPLIRIGGKYLEEFGFAIGDRLEIHFAHEQIVINKIISTPPSQRKA
ncbi:MAG TPA: SymE family type I addiction module toxin [Ignavibacteriaceae bacterium]|nr:SymE family type I addiction module toxin [Ignavibacteriaceae bacterium]